VADIPAAEGFYNGALGLDVMVRSYPGALFLSAGGYHHHLGLNTWQSQGAPPPPDGALGLDRYELVLPDAAARDDAAERLADAGDPVRLEEGVLATDPSGNRVLLTARGGYSAERAASRKSTSASSSSSSRRSPKLSGMGLKVPSAAGPLVILSTSDARVRLGSR
jgi:catechol 2,3-dioxygenase-like lactoylglutathione lyase family enzyme